MTVTPEQAAPPRESPYARFLIVLIVIEIFAVTETAMAFAAIPTFMRVFEADSAAVGWTTTAYLLVGACFAATAGRLGDMFGRRKILTLVLAGAAVGSLVSVLAVDLWMVVLGRGMQGLAAGALPISFGLVRELLPRRRVALGIALLGGVVPICSGSGALLAGVLIDQSGWRAMFVVAAAMGVGAAIVSQTGLPRTPGIIPRPRFDLPGAVLLVPASAGVLFGLTKSEEWGWTDRAVVLPILVGLVAFAVWVWWERRVREPIVDVRQFTDRKVSLTTVATILVGMGPMGAITLLSPMVLQLPKETSIGHGLSPTSAGALQLVLAVICYAGAWGSGRVAQLVGARWSLAIACVLYVTGGMAWVLVTESLVGTVICLGVMLMGSNFSLPSFSNLVVEAVPAEQTGAATGMNRVALNIGVAAGTSVTAVILAFSTLPGTHLPTQTALSAAFAFIIGTSLVSLVLALLIGGGRPVREPAAATPELGSKEAAV